MAWAKTPKHHVKNKKSKTPSQVAQFKKFASKGGKASAAKRRGTHLKHARKSTRGRPRTVKQKAALKQARKHRTGSWNKGKHYHLKHARKKSPRKAPRKTTNPHKAATSKRSTSSVHRFANVRFSKNVSNYRKRVTLLRWGTKNVNAGSPHSAAIPGYNPFSQ